jgi:hypothetical protein
MNSLKTISSIESASGILRSERGAAGFPRLPQQFSRYLGEQKHRVVRVSLLTTFWIDWLAATFWEFVLSWYRETARRKQRKSNVLRSTTPCQFPSKCVYVSARKGTEWNVVGRKPLLVSTLFNLFSDFPSLQRRRNGSIYCVGVFDFVIVCIKGTRSVCVLWSAVKCETRGSHSVNMKFRSFGAVREAKRDSGPRKGCFVSFSANAYVTCWHTSTSK